MILSSLISKYKQIATLRDINQKLNAVLLKIKKYELYSASELFALYEENRAKIKEYQNSNQIDYDTTSPVFDDTVVTVTAIICLVSNLIRNEMPFESQIQGALALNHLNAIELPTGQGKTLTAVISAIYRAIWSNKIHIVTANDYLAYRDYLDMYDLYEFFNITVGYITRELDYKQKIEQYKFNVVYISNQEIGFDYLKSNMQYSLEDIAIKQEDFVHVIIDELDLILIDNARIPTIISTTISNNESFYYKTAYKIINQFEAQDVDIDYKEKNVFIKLENITRLEVLICQNFNIDILDLYKAANIDIFFYIDRCLRAKFLFTKNNEYIVAKSEILVIDEYTGRIAGDRKFSMGIHQALEAKENLKISVEGISTNYITTQNIYRKYKYLSGMTGTIATDSEEIEVIYKANVVKITCHNKNMIMYPDIFFTTKENKYEAIATKVKALSLKQQPVLIGTSNIQESEEIANYLKKHDVKFNILNAKCLDTEAKIISNAGKPGRVTIATSLAGRGTDIKLGGNLQSSIKKAMEQYENQYPNEDLNTPEHKQNIKSMIETIKTQYEKDKRTVIESGGLFVIISQKQENRRIEQQFRGRAGRIQDPGATQTFVSLEDEIFTINKVKINILMPLLTGQEGKYNFILSHLATRLQKQHEKSMFYARINVMNQDHALSNGREVFFRLRNDILLGNIDVIETGFNVFNGLLDDIKNLHQVEISKKYRILMQAISVNEDIQLIHQILSDKLRTSSTQLKSILNNMEKNIIDKYLSVLDHKWSVFINSKETKKRIISLQSNIDYILDYNYFIHQLFTEVMDDHEIILAKIIYKEIDKHFV